MFPGQGRLEAVREKEEGVRPTDKWRAEKSDSQRHWMGQSRGSVMSEEMERERAQARQKHIQIALSLSCSCVILSKLNHLHEP